MKNFLIFFIKRTTIFQKLYQRSTEPAKQKQVLVKLIPPTCIRTQELQGGLWFKTASMRQASHTSLLCACFIILTFASRQTVLPWALRIRKCQKKSTVVKEYLWAKFWLALSVQFSDGLLSKRGHRKSPEKFTSISFKVWPKNFKGQVPQICYWQQWLMISNMVQVYKRC